MPALHPAITVSRALGSGGATIAYRVARRLGWRWCDRVILRQAASCLGLQPGELQRQEERPQGFLEHCLRLIPFGSPEVPYAPPLELPAYDVDLFRTEAQVMRLLVEEGPALLLGRAGYLALAGRPRTLHVRVQASRDWRIQRLLELHASPDAAEALRRIDASDQQRDAYCRALTGAPLPAPGHFDLVLDADRLGLEGCEARILEAAARL